MCHLKLEAHSLLVSYSLSNTSSYSSYHLKGNLTHPEHLLQDSVMEPSNPSATSGPEQLRQTFSKADTQYELPELQMQGRQQHSSKKENLGKTAERKSQASRQTQACIENEHRIRGFLTWGFENSSPVSLCFIIAAFPGMFLASTGISKSIAQRNI